MDYKDIVLDKIDVIKNVPYHNNKHLEWWTPAMYLPYGLEHHDNKFGEKYEVKLSFRDQQGNFLRKFMNKINSLDAYFKHIHKGTEYHPMIKSGNLVLKLPYTGTKFQCTVTSAHDPLPTVFNLKAGMWVRCLVRAEKVWFYQKRSGCLLVAKHFIILNQQEEQPGDSLENE
jgi:hypothetical protein